MSHDDDDYLSDKFLVEESKPTRPSTYSQLRKDALKQSHLKNEQNKQKSRRQRELEAREEGLSTSLFERAKRDAEAGLSHQNKALSIMMKMGFKPGQSLGNTDHEQEGSPAATDAAATASRSREEIPVATGASGSGTGTPSLANQAKDSRAGSPSEAPHTHFEPSDSVAPSPRTHRAEPLPIVEWGGRKGIGLGKRARSPGVVERMAKMAKMEQDADQRDFRSRARDEYNNRQAQGRLGPAQRTCATLDEQKGKSFNVLWLNPDNHNTFPPGFLDALTMHSSGALATDSLRHQGDSIEMRLKRQMQADALHRPFDKIGEEGDEDEESGLASKPDPSSTLSGVDLYPPDLLEEAAQFLRLQALDRLHLVLSYLRDEHAYCFWCGVHYIDMKEMEEQCPGPDEDDHD